jgi:hypothetical protein
VAASVAPFVLTVAAWLAFVGGAARPQLSGRLRVDDLASVAYALQQRLQIECAEVAADARDRERAARREQARDEPT